MSTEVKGKNKEAAKKQKDMVESTQIMADKAKVMTEGGKSYAMLKDGTKVEVYKCRAKNVGRVMDFIALVMSELHVESFESAPKEIDLLNPDVILPLLTKVSSRIVYLSADLCDLEVETVEDLELDDMINLVTIQFEVNKDFFLKNVLPSVQWGQTG